MSIISRRRSQRQYLATIGLLLLLMVAYLIVRGQTPSLSIEPLITHSPSSMSMSTDSPSSVLPENPIIIPPSLTNLNINDRLPTLARVIYLILCENQGEVDAFSTIFPSITADAIYFCWKELCRTPQPPSTRRLFVAPWSRISRKNRSIPSKIEVQPRAIVINEQTMNLTYRTTWTLARNLLLERVLEEERHQGWRWAYFNFLDGDVTIECPVAKKILHGSVTAGDEMIVARRFRALIEQSINQDLCFVLFDTFLLMTSPAIGVVANTGLIPLYSNLFAQIVYHIDAMFNGFHRDAIPFLLPYCPRYDGHSWWTSQVILMYRSLCLYGHIIQFNAIMVTRQIHRPYPRNGDPFLIHNDMHLVPKFLLGLKEFMQRARTVSAIILRHYSGWSLTLTSPECRQYHTHIDPRTCRVRVLA